MATSLLVKIFHTTYDSVGRVAANEVDVENSSDDAQEIEDIATAFFLYEDAGVSSNELEGEEPVSAPYHYF